MDGTISNLSDVSYQVTTLSQETGTLSSAYEMQSIAIERPIINGYDFRINSQQDIFHQFPYTFDKQIVKEGYIFKIENGGTYFIAFGTINGTEGIYTIGINNWTGKIFHRCFYEMSRFKNFH